ncbi:hypothetical protein [Amantichitinum ursilacus]|uniref:Uncharacterized protein n=1 Tax=Amantichitinum ursilacus TaxID=857265 RepID=A0A0N1JSK4_9NEIS|nr:hypothetical protein [Amantichitinum ursilacus]KPC52586.1 hypothetical protein WG78_12100 [Amantichitinum ursilacus]
MFDPASIIGNLPFHDALPSGRQIKDESNGAIYLSLDNGLRLIPNLNAWHALFINDAAQQHAPVVGDVHKGRPLGHDAALIKGEGEGKVYLLDDGTRRWIVSPEVFNRFQFDWAKIRTVANHELNAMPEGNDIE